MSNAPGEGASKPRPFTWQETGQDRPAPREIGVSSRVFATTDTTHSDNEAPTGSGGPFRGKNVVKLENFYFPGELKLAFKGFPGTAPWGLMSAMQKIA
ncbi:MAG: hypothetical protein CL933_17115 [Deltaproteobacteria bacterium]|nr:hypothetical protein [Deltaproteobacteria bacterium]